MSWPPTSASTTARAAAGGWCARCATCRAPRCSSCPSTRASWRCWRRCSRTSPKVGIFHGAGCAHTTPCPCSCASDCLFVGPSAGLFLKVCANVAVMRTCGLELVLINTAGSWGHHSAIHFAAWVRHAPSVPTPHGWHVYLEGSHNSAGLTATVLPTYYLHTMCSCSAPHNSPTITQTVHALGRRPAGVISYLEDEFQTLLGRKDATQASLEPRVRNARYLAELCEIICVICMHVPPLLAPSSLHSRLHATCTIEC